MRASGDPCLQHCVETAALLAELGAGSVVVAAGLLHDTVDHAGLEYGFISEQFGARVADLVKGVSNLIASASHSDKRTLFFPPKTVLVAPPTAIEIT